MIKQLVKIGNSQGVIIDKTILDLMKMTCKDSFDVEIKAGGLFLRPIVVRDIYQRRAIIHKKSLERLRE